MPWFCTQVAQQDPQKVWCMCAFAGGGAGFWRNVDVKGQRVRKVVRLRIRAGVIVGVEVRIGIGEVEE